MPGISAAMVTVWASSSRRSGWVRMGKLGWVIAGEMAVCNLSHFPAQPERLALPEQLRHDFSMHIREAEVAALGAVDELGVIEAKQVQDGGVQVVDVDGILDGVEAELIAPAQREPALHAAAGEPHAEASRVA